MNPSFFSKLTDDELAEWHMLTTRAEHLNEQLLSAQNKIVILEADVRRHIEDSTNMRADYAADFDRASREAQRAGDAAAKWERELREVCNALLPALIDWLDGFSAFKDEALADAIVERRRAAVALMRRMTPWSM